jgi:hypothetical protein
VRRLRVVLEAAAPQRLPRLPSNALRGALGHAARTLGDASLAGLLEAEGDGGLESATAGRPAALLARGPFSRDRAGFVLDAGDTLAFELSLIGDAALDAEPLVLRGLRRAAEGGIGIPKDEAPEAEGPESGGRASGRGRARRRRPGLRLVRAAPVEAPPLDRGASRWLLDFTTPLRLRERGRELVAPDADALWRGWLRRADHLARAFGQGPVCAWRNDVPRPFEATWRGAEPAVVHRVSARQHRAMRWRGTLGVLELVPRPGEELAPWIALAHDVGLGKGAAQGFGCFEPLPVG